jgi:hypothetical protein
MSLPIATTNKDWFLYANNQDGTLHINQPDSNGIYNGTVTFSGVTNNIIGSFYDVSQVFTFIRLPNGGTVASQGYSGVLGSMPPFTVPNGPNIETHTIYTLTGQFLDPNIPDQWFIWQASYDVVQTTPKLKEVEKYSDVPPKIAKDINDAHIVPQYIPSYLQVTDLNTVISQLMLRLSTIEQRLATGRSFVAPAERPAVGQQAVDAPPRTDDATNT